MTHNRSLKLQGKGQQLCPLLICVCVTSVMNLYRNTRYISVNNIKRLDYSIIKANISLETNRRLGMNTVMVGQCE
jgi:hypothetical protein